MAKKRRLEDSAEMDMTPMIDIVFNLLIFFMVITDLSQKDLAELTLPLAYMAAEDKDDDEDDRIILNIDKKGQLLVRGKARSLDELGTFLSQAKREYNLMQKAKGKSGEEVVAGGAKASRLYVLLRADKDTPWQHVQWIMTMMAEEKLFKLQFATKKFIDAELSGGPDGKGRDPHLDMLGGLTQKEAAKLKEQGG